MPATMEPRTVVPAQAQASWDELQGRVRVVRRRHAFKFVAQGVLLGWAVFAAAFLGFSLVDIFFKLSVGSRVAWLAAALGGLVGAVFLATLRPFAKLGDRVQTARDVEGAFPELENQLSTTLEYGADSKLIETSGPELVGALIKRTEARTEPLDFGRTVRWRRALPAFLLAAWVAGLVALYGLLSPRLFLTTWQRFLKPTAAIAPPTLTVIEKVEPGDNSYPVESSVRVRVTLSGHLPETATLMLQKPDDPPDRWEERVMERDPDGSYHSYLRRMLDTMRCRIVAHDTESAVFTLRVYREPQVDEFSLRVEHPEYTRRVVETLPPGVGDVRALCGTKITVNLKANTDLAKAEAVFESKREPAAGNIAGRTAQLSFDLRNDDTYQLHIKDPESHANAAPGTYRLKALRDHPPRVRIRKPERDLMVQREQTAKLEITATDDLGVGEIGIFHSLGLQEAKTMVRRVDPDAPQTSVEGKHTWELGSLGLKGGEVIAYYAYAIDNDTLSGPKTGKSELHFLTVYDEEEYDSPQAPKPQGQGTPEAVKNLDKLIEVQKKLLQETFTLARNREASEAKEPTDPEKQASAKTAQAQRDLKGKVEELAAAVAQEIEKMGAAEEPEQKEDEEGRPQRNPMGVKELEHMRNAAGKMGTAADQLAETKPAPAVTPEMEALRELSETRRLLLSQKEGDPRFKMAMNDQSKKNKNNENQQKQQDMAQAQKEMIEMPPMLEREREIERELEKLEELRPRQKQKPQPPQTEEQKQEEKQKDEQRRQLKRKVEDQLQKLADDAKERAENLHDIAKRNEELRTPAEKARSAAEKVQQAQEDAKKDQHRQAQDKAHESARDMQEAFQDIRNELEKQFREQLASLKNDAQELAQRQQDLAQSTREMQQQAQPQGEQKSKPQGEQPSNQQQPGQQASSGQPDSKSQAKMQAISKRQGEVASDLNALAERLEAAARQAESKQLPSAQSLQEAQAQAKSDAPADRSARSAQESLSKGQGEKAQNEQERAARELEKVAQSLEKAIQKTEAADMKALAAALQKAREVTREQEQVNEALAQGKPTTEMIGREEKVASASQNLAAEAQKLEALKRQNRAGNAKEQFERAASQAWEAAEQLRVSAPDKAKEPAGRAEQALNAAVSEMERAAGQRLEDAARKAQALAKDTREKQEEAAEQAREIPQPEPGKPMPSEATEKRDQAAAQERDAARKAHRLDQALEGLEEISKEIQPAASQIAKEPRETSQDAKLPQSMEELARDLQNMGTPKLNQVSKQPTPTEAGQRGDELAKTVKQVERQLEQFIAQANGTPLDRLRALEQEAKANTKEAQRLSEQAKETEAPKEPKESKEVKQDPGKPLGEQAGKLEKSLERMEPKLGHLEAGAPERKQLEQARESVKQAQKELKQSQGKSGEQSGPNGGAALDKAKQHLEKMSSGLTERMERILKAREVQPDEDEVAPKEYRTLVDQYYRALSEDVEEKQ